MGVHMAQQNTTCKLTSRKNAYLSNCLSKSLSYMWVSCAKSPHTKTSAHSKISNTHTCGTHAWVDMSMDGCVLVHDGLER
eukprot:10516842-Alexandrium_andersonii.AAC.1